jgi:hypothetical protein
MGSNGAVVNGGTLVLSYDEALALVAPTAANYAIITTSATALSITGASLNTVNNTVSLSLNRAVTSSETIHLSYSATKRVQDLAGNVAANFTALAITNATPSPDTTTPVIDFAPANGQTIDRSVTSANGGLVSLDDDTSPATLTEASDQLTEIRITVGGLQDGTS